MRIAVVVGFIGFIVLASNGCAGVGGDSFDGGVRPADATPDVRLLDAPIDDSAPPPRDADAAADGAPMPAACPAGECDPSRAGDCGDAACTIGADGQAHCTMAAGTGAAGSPCTESGQCQPGLGCFGADGIGTCAQVCCPGELALCPGDLRCHSGTLADGTSTPWGYCAPARTCDVLRPTSSCRPGEGCYIVEADGGTECRFSGMGEAGAPCMVPEDCAAGFFCGGLRTRTCRRICSLDDPMSCPEGEGRCVAYSYSPEGTGICTVM